MTSFCDFVPDDPSCAPPANPNAPTDNDNQIEDQQMYDDGKMDSSTLMQAQVAYLLTAFTSALNAALQQFHYRNTTTFYAAGDSLSINYWEYIVMTWNYFTIAWMGVATITQLLSMFGIGAEINVMVWLYGGILNMYISFVTGLFAMYAYELYWQLAEASTGSYGAMDATIAFSSLELDMLARTAKETAAGFTLYMNHEAWMTAQWKAIPEETKSGDPEEDLRAYFGF